MAIRKIIEIDEEKCTGCGECILSCAEGALEIIDGKAKLVSDVYCDGLGACLGECPEGALNIIERDAPEFDEEEAMERVERLKKEEAEKAAPIGCGCPSSEAITFDHSCECGGETSDAGGGGEDGDISSRLGHFPIKLQLLNPAAPFLKNADLLLLADCAATCYPNLHRDYLGGRAVAMGCPKLDNLDAHIERLAEIVEQADLKSLTVLRMEVPCCGGFVHAATEAVKRAGVNLDVQEIVVSRDGKVLRQQAAV